MHDPLISFVNNYWALQASDYDISTGSIIEHSGSLIFEVQKPSRWKSSSDFTEVGYVGIGGKLERDESVYECIEREVREELGQPAKLLSAATTILVDSNAVAERRTLPFATNPIAILRQTKTEQGRAAFTVVFVFQVALSASPILGDIGGLVLVPTPALKHLSVNGNTAAEFERLKILIEGTKDLPRNVRFVPFGTARAMVTHSEQFSL